MAVAGCPHGVVAINLVKTLRLVRARPRQSGLHPRLRAARASARRPVVAMGDGDRGASRQVETSQTSERDTETRGRTPFPGRSPNEPFGVSPSPRRVPPSPPPPPPPPPRKDK